MSKVLLGIASFALSAALSGTAAGAPYFITYEGTVTSGYDQSGLFGTPDSLLTGLAIDVIYTYDAPDSVLMNGDATATNYIGGALYRRSAYLSAKVVINDRSVSIGGSYASRYQEQQGYIFNSAQDFDSTHNYAVVDTVVDTDLPSGLGSVFSASVPASAINAGLFQFETSTDYSFATSILSSITSGAFRTTSVRVGTSLASDGVGADGAVPEPATWAMTIVGAGLIGAAMRRQPVRACGARA